MEVNELSKLKAAGLTYVLLYFYTTKTFRFYFESA